MHRLITSADRRLVVEQIKKHDFFYGVDWDTIRQIEAPFIPHLSSVTDTSYFPTDELDQVPEETPAEASAASKDLPFLGYVNFTSNSLIRRNRNLVTRLNGFQSHLMHSKLSVLRCTIVL